MSRHGTGEEDCPLARSHRRGSLVWIAVAGIFAYRAGWHVHLRAAVAFLIGDSGGCTWASVGFHPELDRRYKAGVASSRLLESTPDGLRRIQTPLGAFWARKDTDGFYVVTEQLMRVYGDGPYRVRKGDIVLDCSANIGTFTREALSAWLISRSPSNPFPTMPRACGEPFIPRSPRAA